MKSIKSPPKWSSAVCLGLKQSHFKPIATGGFGDAHNAYPHSAIWFQNRLIVGTTRANLCMLKVSKMPTRFAQWPINCPDDLYQLDMRGQIWAYEPQADQWVEVFRSPYLTLADQSVIPRDLGYRGMALFQGTSDTAPALYVATYASARGPGAFILRSSDGRHFEAVSKPGLLELPTTTIRALIPFKNQLFTAPTGRAGGHPNRADIPVIYASADPAGGEWVPVNEPGFGDPENGVIFELATCGDFLYAGTGHFRQGFQLWRTRAEGRPPYDWECVIRQGGGRGVLNQVAVSMTAFRGALYVGTGIQQGGVDQVNKVGPAAPELFRVTDDGQWDLIVGLARQTEHGFKTPLSGYRPGFNNPFTGYFWRLIEHDGWLYLGTLNWTTMMQFADAEQWPTRFRQQVQHLGLPRILAHQTGAELYRSADGENWIPVTQDGFQNPFNYGIRTLVSSPQGLFVGCANPFGPQIARCYDKQWVYEENPRGGLEIWQGKRDEL